MTKPPHAAEQVHSSHPSPAYPVGDFDRRPAYLSSGIFPFSGYFFHQGIMKNTLQAQSKESSCQS
jgi:hypothetical protein